jgi:SagB-type dehydrogenase family enzyme
MSAPWDESVASELERARVARPQLSEAEAPSWRHVGTGARVALGALVDDASDTLGSVLARRRSERECNPPPLRALATMLVRSLRVVEWRSDPCGYVTSHRPVPSAGARHPIDVHLLAGEVDGLRSGTWQFDPLTCELVQTTGEHEPALRVLGEIVGRDAPPAAIVGVAHLDRTLARYPEGLSLVWRDAGALLATLHLCATDLGLSSCIVGATGVLRWDPGASEVDVGSMIVGAPA